MGKPNTSDKIRVLLIDDDAELGSMLTRILCEPRAFPPWWCPTREDGVEAAMSGDHDVVVLDVMLPTLNGVEVLRRIRQTSGIPIIMLTAKGDHVDRIVGLEMGADDYVPKPCYPRELVARLRAVLRRTEGSATPGRTQVLVPRRVAAWCPPSAEPSGGMSPWTLRLPNSTCWRP